MDSTLDATPNAIPSASTQTPTGSVQGTKVWKHFNREEKPNKIVDATCKYCSKRFDGTSRAGTSHLNNHLKSCIQSKRQFIDISQSFLGKVIGGNDPQPKASINKFDPSVERALFTKMVAKHDLPFMLCQFEYFHHWISFIMPTYNFHTRNTVKSNLMDVYKIENLCRNPEIIAFHVVEYPHHGVRLSEWLRNRILEWNIDNNIFSIVVDNISNSMGMFDGIKTWLIGKKALRH
ncbi:hypothetical protein CDL12_21900 [Handroanthus impetiginosus]|uniref:BED-type domain-containing protein n=1 Tax=Handroanthus impetiginosus TaxID=429701 RepID=A0A2G9GJY1_9LAMI|nr:hypothetical protein CDL12_21900 [Handroanthus impetiginosus]